MDIIKQILDSFSGTLPNDSKTAAAIARNASPEEISACATEEGLHALRSTGIDVFSPYHDVGRGSANDIYIPDINGIQDSCVLLAYLDGLDPGTLYEIGYAKALGKPVVVFVQNEDEGDLKMITGAGCTTAVWPIICWTRPPVNRPSPMPSPSPFWPKTPRRPKPGRRRRWWPVRPTGWRRCWKWNWPG